MRARGMVLAAGVLGLFVTGCESPSPKVETLTAELTAHERIWQEKGSDTYKMTVRDTRFSGAKIQTEYRIWVDKGVVKKVESRASQAVESLEEKKFEPVEINKDSEAKLKNMTVAELFRMTRTGLDGSTSYNVSVDYDEELGYPRLVEWKAKPGTSLMYIYIKVEVESLELNATAH